MRVNLGKDSKDMDRFRKKLELPLSEIIRPEQLEDVIGQKHLIDPDFGIISNFILLGYLPLMVLHGPPGVGKTTLARALADATKYVFVELSATDSTISELKDIVKAIRSENRQRRLISDKDDRLRVAVFIDEIHRFSSVQQDFLLPFVESGDFVFIGATTVDPQRRIRKAILSRCQLFELVRLTSAEIRRVVEKAVVFENIRRRINGGERERIILGKKAIDRIVELSNGDSRAAINAVELLNGEITGDDVTEALRMATKQKSGLSKEENVPKMVEMFYHIREIDIPDISDIRDICENSDFSDFSDDNSDFDDFDDSNNFPEVSKVSDGAFVDSIVELLQNGELAAFLLRQLILFGIVFVEDKRADLRRFMTSWKVLKTAAVEEKQVILDLVKLISGLRKSKGVPLTRVLIEMNEYFDLFHVDHQPRETKRFPVVYHDDIVATLLECPSGGGSREVKPLPVTYPESFDSDDPNNSVSFEGGNLTFEGNDLTFEGIDKYSLGSLTQTR